MPCAFVRGMIWLEICNDGQAPPMMGPGGPPPPHWGLDLELVAGLVDLEVLTHHQ